MALAHRGMASIEAHRFDEAEDALRAALAVAEEGFEDVAFAANVWLVSTLVTRNRLVEAELVIQRAMALAAQIDDAANRAILWSFVAFIHNWAARFDQAMEAVQRWWAVAADSPVWHPLLTCGWLEGMARAGKGEYRQALAVVRDTLALCERIGDYHARGSCLNVLGWIHGELQDHEGAVDLNSQSLRSALKRKSPDPECQHNARLNLGDSLMALGRLDEAAEQFQIVERTVRRPQPHEHYMLWRYSQHLFHSYGELRLARGDHDRAFALAGECLALAESSDSKKNIVKARRLRSQVLLARGKPEEATPEIEAALTMARKVGNPPQLWRTLTAFGDLLRANGSGEEAGQAYREALLVIETVAAALDDPALSNIFLSSEQVKRVRHQAGCGAD